VPGSAEKYDIGSNEFYFVAEDMNIKLRYFGNDQNHEDQYKMYNVVYFFEGVELDREKEADINTVIMAAFLKFTLYLTLVMVLLLAVSYCRMRRLAYKITRPVIILLERIETML